MDVPAVALTMGSGTLPAPLEECVRSLVLRERSRFFLMGGATAAQRTELCTPPHDIEEAVYEVELLGMTHIRDVMGDGEVTKRRLVQGKGQFPVDCPVHDALVRLRIHSIRIEGVEDPIFAEPDVLREVHTGQAKLPELLETCVRIMVPGERSLLCISPKHAALVAWHGSEHFPAIPEGSVPSDAAVIFDLELESFERYKYMSKQSFQERVDECRQQREMGNALFRHGKFELARDKYKLCLGILDECRPDTDEEWALNDAVKIPVLLNYGAACNKLGQHREAIKYLDKLLRFDGYNVKALYRRGCAHLALDEFKAAEENFLAMRDFGGKEYSIDATSAFDMLSRAREDKRRREAKDYGEMFEKKIIPDRPQRQEN